MKAPPPLRNLKTNWLSHCLSPSPKKNWPLVESSWSDSCLKALICFLCCRRRWFCCIYQGHTNVWWRWEWDWSGQSLKWRDKTQLLYGELCSTSRSRMAQLPQSIDCKYQLPQNDLDPDPCGTYLKPCRFRTLQFTNCDPKWKLKKREKNSPQKSNFEMKHSALNFSNYEKLFRKKIPKL